MTPTTYNPMRPRRSVRSGFTLLELMLALAMSAAIAVPLYSALRVAYRAKDGAEQSLAASRTIDLAMEFLRSDLENAMVPTANSYGYAVTTTSNTTTAAATDTSTTGTALSLAGSFIGTDTQDDRGHDGDDVIFYTNTDGPSHSAPNLGEPNGDGEIRMVELTVITLGNGDHALVRRVTRNLLSQQQVTPDDEIICRRVASFNVRYYDGSNWQDTWDSTQQNNELPAAVEVTMSLDPPPGDPRPPQNYVRMFPLIMSTLITDNNASTTTTTGTTSTGSTGTGAKTATGGKTQ